MATDYAIYALGQTVAGNLQPAPVVPRLGGQASLADDTASAALTVTVPAVVAVVAAARSRIDFRATTGALDPATSPEVLEANIVRYFALPIGTTYLKVTAYV